LHIAFTHPISSVSLCPEQLFCLYCTYRILMLLKICRQVIIQHFVLFGFVQCFLITFMACILGWNTVVLMLCSSHCILPGGTQFLCITLLVTLTLIS
jgi:hypothetical protein